MCVRCFEDDDVTHVEGRIDPIADIETVETELMLADLDSLERRVDALEKKAKGGDKEAKDACSTSSNRALALLRDGKPARLVELQAERSGAFAMLGLLTAKPVLYVCNVEEAAAADRQRVLAQGRSAWRKAKAPGSSSSPPQIEAEIAMLPRGERERISRRRSASTRPGSIA